MLIATQHREKLNLYCMIRKITQEIAVNDLVAEGLQRLDADPVMKERMDKAQALKEALANL
jgi:hypothetical protein